MKQWISLLLAMVLLFSCIPVGAMATEDARLKQPAVKLSNIQEGISLEWDAVEGSESYLVYRAATDEYRELLDEVTETRYEDHSAEDGVTYHYSVIAKNGDELIGDELSAEILRLAKSKLSVYNVYEGITIKWTAVKGAESYSLYRQVPGGTWEVLKTGLTELSYIDQAVQFASEYVYAIQACNTTGGSAYATKQVIRIDQPTAKGSNAAEGVKITWNEVAAAESYNVYRKAPGGSWVLLSNETGTAYMDTTAESGVKYSYRVRAKNGNDLSSNKLSFNFLRMGQPTISLLNIAGGISIKWDAVAGATYYRVYRQNADGTWKQLVSGLTELSYTDTAVEYGVTYNYSVRTYNNGYMSPHHLNQSIIRIQQPEAVVTNKAAGVQITWNEVVGAECYNIYRKAVGGSWKTLSTETGTTYVDTTAKSGVTYIYRVKAQNGDTLSSNKHSATIMRLERPKATAYNVNKGVVVKWNAIEGAESYRVMRRVPGGSWSTIASDVTELQYTDTTAKSGTTYQYTVRAYANGYLGSYYATKDVHYLSRPVATATTASTTSVKIQWNAVAGAEEYIVYIETGDSEWTELDTVTGTSYTAKGLTFGETYSFGVRAVSDLGRSTRSASASGKATYPAPEYTVELKSGKGIQISWTAMDGAGSYRVYRRVEGGSWKTLKTTTSTSYLDTTGQPGVTYEYGVRAFELAKAEGIYGIRATGKKAVYSQVDPSKPMVALTFDDGPSAYTSAILDQLEKYDAHATFFVVGNRVSSYASTIKRAYSLGCEIGNHSWSHPQLSAISVQEMKNEISKTDAAIEKVIGEKAALLRPPYGAVDADVKKYAGKPLIHWSIDTLDWSTRNSSSTISSVLNNVKDGSIVLMHDIYAPTRDAAVSLIPTLISRGYQLVTVSEMAAYRGITLQDGTIYYSIR